MIVINDNNKDGIVAVPNMVNCRDCIHLALISEHGDFERRCVEGLGTRYEDHDCEKYNRSITNCSCCD